MYLNHNTGFDSFAKLKEKKNIFTESEPRGQNYYILNNNKKNIL